MPISKHKERKIMENPDETKRKSTNPPVPTGTISKHKERKIMENPDQTGRKATNPPIPKG